ncbi:SspB family protein [Hyphomicrobium sp.]|uniref:SspB family protein n=1 Tax=Hyphomicrobium sp. TaxID=82 RepID=UPI002E36A11A|nr:ClpXP protease specificity-enhancing factor SspB [Hyphomicrobium sp.]HEX2840232.1 ClpXP protease specificity-enhancing factor SspB [Hyphomicrobium sp.]
MTVESTIDYEGLAQEAMRGVVRKVLASTAKSGLAGDHHFYISFDTEAPGVTLSKRLKEKYPREMTIVLQHRFWDLAVTEDRFEVKLTFDGIPERLVVPFDAIKVFFDPSVRFGLQFEDPNAGPEGRTQSDGGTFESMTARAGATRTRKAARTRKTQTLDDANDKASASGESGAAPSIEPAAEDASAPTPLAAKSGSKRSNSDEAAPSSNDAEAPIKPGGAEIVSLDKFRKK